MTDTAELIRYIQNSQLPEGLKSRFIPLIQTASPQTQEEFYEKLKLFNEKAVRIRKGTEPLTVDDVIFIHGYVEDYQERKQQEKLTQVNNSLLTSNGR